MTCDETISFCDNKTFVTNASFRVHVLSGAERELRSIRKLIHLMWREQQAIFWQEFLNT